MGSQKDVRTRIWITGRLPCFDDHYGQHLRETTALTSLLRRRIGKTWMDISLFKKKTERLGSRI
jgi:hypothetical protein